MARLLKKEDNTKLNDVRWLSVVMLRMTTDWKPMSITSARQEIEQNSSRYEICIPVEGLHAEGLTTFETLSKTFWDTMSQDWPELLDTYKLLLYKRWDETWKKPRVFKCPYCETNPLSAILENGADYGICNNPECGHPIACTDFEIGFPRRMGQKGDIEKIPGLLLNTIETLALVNEIRAQIDKGDVSECLFVNDGPLRVEDHELARSIILFLRFIHKSGHKLHIVSQEKSGRFYDHIEYVEPHLKPREIFIPSDEYIQSEIQRRDEKRIKKRQVVYGSSHNLGIKVYAKFGERQTLILNVPSIMSPSKKET